MIDRTDTSIAVGYNRLNPTCNVAVPQDVADIPLLVLGAHVVVQRLETGCEVQSRAVLRKHRGSPLEKANS